MGTELLSVVKQPEEDRGAFMEMDELVSDVLYVLSVRAGAVISCCRNEREVGATVTAVTSHELRERRNTFLDKMTARTL